jgi:ribonuclease P protein component
VLSVSKQFTLGKNERLKSRKQIENLFAEGNSFAVNPFKVYFLVSGLESAVNKKNPLQFGVGVGAKNFKKAVDRNRIKRLTREAWRLQKKELKEMAIGRGNQMNVFLVYTGKELPDFMTVKDKVAVALKKLVVKLNENNLTNS